MNKKSQKAEDSGLPNTYILKVKFEGHRTWRIAITNRKFDKVIAAVQNMPATLSDYEIWEMDGLTGEFKKLEK